MQEAHSVHVGGAHFHTGDDERFLFINSDYHLHKARGGRMEMTIKLHCIHANIYLSVLISGSRRLNSPTQLRAN